MSSCFLQRSVSTVEMDRRGLFPVGHTEPFRGFFRQLLAELSCHLPEFPPVGAHP
jgi:hypothetical protein